MQVQYKKIQRLQVDVEDATTTSIAVHFPTCFDFITKAQAGGGVVFVHWYVSQHPQQPYHNIHNNTQCFGMQ